MSHEGNRESKAGVAAQEQPSKTHAPSSFSVPPSLDFGFLLHDLKKRLYSEQENKAGDGTESKRHMRARSIPFKTFF